MLSLCICRLALVLPVGLYNDGVEVLDARLHLCGHGVTGPQRYHVHNLALGHSLDKWLYGQIFESRDRDREKIDTERRES